MNETQHPLILVFYLDAELMRNKQIMMPFADYVNSMIEAKKANIMAFFLPTIGEERVECINPIMMSEPDMEKINSIVEEIKVQFSVGIEEDINLCECDKGKCCKDKKITPCDCGNVPCSECECKNNKTND
jgi:hypothetical protein